MTTRGVTGDVTSPYANDSTFKHKRRSLNPNSNNEGSCWNQDPEKGSKFKTLRESTLGACNALNSRFQDNDVSAQRWKLPVLPLRAKCQLAGKRRGAFRLLLALQHSIQQQQLHGVQNVAAHTPVRLSFRVEVMWSMAQSGLWPRWAGLGRWCSRKRRLAAALYLRDMRL